MKSYSIRFVFIIIVLVLAALACSFGKSDDQTAVATAQPVTGSTEQPLPTAPEQPKESISLDPPVRIEDQGFTFQPISGYTLDTTLFPQMLAPGADPDTGPAFMLVGGEAEPGTTAESLIASMQSEEVVVGETIKVTVGGVEGLSTTIQRLTGNLSGRVVTVMVTPNQQFAMMGIAPQAQWDAEVSALFDAVLATVTFFEPAVVVEPELPAQPPAAELTEIRQWASTAFASSEYGSDDWSAMQATGFPDVPGCGDFEQSWAASSSMGVEWIELGYQIPVNPTQVNIVITYNPIFVSKVELLDTNGSYHQVYEFEASEYPECPTTFTIDVTETGFQAIGVRITIDQTNAAGWVEIDAVELVGMGDASQQPGGGVQQPANPAAGTGATFAAPQGFLWRMGGEKAFDTYGQFPGVYGADINDITGFIYVADGINSVQVLERAYDNASVNMIGQITCPGMSVPNDVKYSEGMIYVAAWGSGQIFIITEEGECLTPFGERGTGEGQFGDFSPTRLAVAPSGMIFALDRNVDQSGNWYERIHMFYGDGTFLGTINFDDDWFTPGGMDADSSGNLYVVGFVGSYILKYDSDGNLLEKIGEDTLSGLGGAQGLALDWDGNFYVALWNTGIVKLDPQGNLLGTWGVPVEDGENPWSEGGFYMPTGIAVSYDGDGVYFTDTSSKYAYITAFRFP